MNKTDLITGNNAEHDPDATDPDATDPGAIAVDRLVDHVLVLDNNPQLDDALILRLQYDLATKTHTYDDIARRYGLTNVAELADYLKTHPNIVTEAKKLRALFNSDRAVEERVRLRFLYATESLIAPMQHIAGDIRTPIGARIDAFKQIQRGAGVDGLPAQQRGAAGGNTGGQPFHLNIIFSNGQRTQISGTPVIDADEIPPADEEES